jgi:uncharacterized protein YbbK (DUF523 family)
MQKILISACLVGDKVNYKGQGNYHPDVEKLKEKYELVLFCPECEGGLPIPRLPNEIRGSQVIRSDGKNVTRAFEVGAKKALAICKYLGISKAVLKENSPSCGTHMVHDGYFQGRKIPGMGVTARLLKDNGIEVFSEEEIEKLL